MQPELITNPKKYAKDVMYRAMSSASGRGYNPSVVGYLSDNMFTVNLGEDSVDFVNNGIGMLYAKTRASGVIDRRGVRLTLQALLEESRSLGIEKSSDLGNLIMLLASLSNPVGKDGISRRDFYDGCGGELYRLASNYQKKGMLRPADDPKKPIFVELCRWFPNYRELLTCAIGECVSDADGVMNELLFGGELPSWLKKMLVGDSNPIPIINITNVGGDKIPIIN